jgi:hypothetical protein
MVVHRGVDRHVPTFANTAVAWGAPESLSLGLRSPVCQEDHGLLTHDTQEVAAQPGECLQWLLWERTRCHYSPRWVATIQGHGRTSHLRVTVGLSSRRLRVNESSARKALDFEYLGAAPAPFRWPFTRP